MTAIGPMLYAELTTYPATHALVEDRVRPKKLVESDPFPQIVYHLVSSPRQYTHGGDSGLRSPRYQFDCWAKDPDTAEAVAEAVVEALSGRSFGGVTFSLVIDEREDLEESTGLFRRMVDAMPHLQE